jgi:RNA polymerase sigma factor (sigma-70 family)
MTASLTETTHTDSSLRDAVEVFLTYRSRLFRIALRVTGDVLSAEDVVQEAWLRWQRTDRRTIQNPAAFLTTTTTRLAINLIQSAPHRHESAAESPLADLVDPRLDPALRTEQEAALEQALAALMAKLSRSELAAYVLRKGFDYAYRDIATLLRTSVPNARQLVRRAQPRIADDREWPVDPDEHRLVARAFLRAARTGELNALEQALTGLDAPDRCHVLPMRRPGRPTNPPHPPRAA